VRVYFVSDIHGSHTCWLKFLAAAQFYSADVIVVGGDLTGKFVVPIVTEPDGRITCVFQGVQRRVRGEQDLAELRKQIAASGAYAFEASREEVDAVQASPERLEQLFHRVVLERVEQWMALADERLNGSDVDCIVNTGNDDFFAVDDVLAAAKRVRVPEGRVLELDHGIEMIGCGYANLTPWRCPRDVAEEELAARIAAAVAQLREPARAIFNLHVPPHDTGIDIAPRLTADHRPVLGPSGEPELVPVGSTAVREAITASEPLLGLHGHIHESRGIRRLGATTVINPGSEYSAGVLNGALIDIDRKGRISQAQLVSG
jgi:Icc-related predicted phosphoesterase